MVIYYVGCVLAGMLLGLGLPGLLCRFRPGRKALDTLDIRRPPYQQRLPINWRTPRTEPWYRGEGGGGDE